MSHFRQKTLVSATALALLTIAGPAVTAQAGINDVISPGLKTPVGKSHTQTAALSEFTKLSEKPVLDWRNPSFSLTFDVPDMDWTPSLRLSLSADPVGNMSRDAEVYVQLNQAAPIKVMTKGRGFDAFLNLDSAIIRPRNNVLSISYGSPAGVECLREEHGAWALNLKKSTLKRQSRTKSRALNISDIDAALSNPLSAPKKVSLIAFGAQKTQFQSLLAQAVGLRSQEMPELNLSSGGSDFEFIAGRREEISHLVKNKTVMQVSGPRLALDEGRPLRVILTGDTDEQVSNLLQAFVQHRLPETRRTLTSTGELRMQPPLSRSATLRSGQTNLADLGPTTFDPGWNPKNISLRFDVEDPVASHGDILLRLDAPESNIAAANKLTLSLNGQSLGQTSLESSNKSVAFEIPQGVLQGQENVLKATSEIGTGDFNECLSPYSYNGLAFGKRSRITLSSDNETPLSDLSRLTATGAPFSDASGKETLLVLPKGDRDYHAALILLAKLAAKQGAGWSEAEFTRDHTKIEDLALQRNVLFILPSQDIPETIKLAAPKSFQSALAGKSQKGDNLLTVEAERYASAQSLDGGFAANASRRNQITQGGVAALYASPYQSDKIVGVITSAAGYSFETALETLSEPSHWNRLEGSVARWNEETVLLTELSSPLPNFVRSAEPASPSGFELEWPELDFSTLGSAFSNIQLPAVNWAQIKDIAIFWNKDEIIEEDAANPSSTTSDLSGVETGRLAQTSEKTLNWIGNKWTSLKTSVSAFNFDKKISNIQKRAQMVKANWNESLKRTSIPGRHIQNWSLQQLSAAVFLFVLLLGMILVLVGFSAPRSQTRRRY